MKIFKFPWLANYINKQIKWLYTPFKKLIPYETFNYLFCGGANTFLDSFLYFLIYNYITKKEDIDLNIFTISPHILAFLIVFPITFLTGFWLSKYITFSSSALKGRTQLFRFGVTITGSILLQYLLLKFFVEICHIFPTPSKLITSGIVAVLTYLMHRFFTFRTASKLN
jgi:putative flippase GtrA